jgi:MoxR-like ATPase
MSDFCFLRRQGLILVSVTDFDAKTFIGEFVLNKDREMVWKDGPLITAMRHGHLLGLDEINMAENQILAALNHALMYREYYIAEIDEWVRAHEHFRCIATMNPHEGYLGTKELNPAVKRRFGLYLTLNYPTPELEFKIVASQSGYDNAEFITQAIEVANALRNDASEGIELISSECSPDHLVRWAKLVASGRDAWRGFELAVVGHAQPHDREHLREVMSRTFGPGPASEDWDQIEQILIDSDEFKRRLNDIKQK